MKPSVQPIIRRFRYLLRAFPVSVSRNWWLRRILWLLRRIYCLLSCKGEMLAAEVEVPSTLTFLRGPDPMAKKTIVANIGENIPLVIGTALAANGDTLSVALTQAVTAGMTFQLAGFTYSILNAAPANAVEIVLNEFPEDNYGGDIGAMSAAILDQPMEVTSIGKANAAAGNTLFVDLNQPVFAGMQFVLAGFTYTILNSAPVDSVSIDLIETPSENYEDIGELSAAILDQPLTPIPATAIVYENSRIVAILHPGESRELQLSGRFVIEAICNAGQRTLIAITTHRRCPCGDDRIPPYGEPIEPVGGDLI